MGAEAGLSMLGWPATDNTAGFPLIHGPKDSFSLLFAFSHRLTPMIAFHHSHAGAAALTAGEAVWSSTYIPVKH